MRDAVVLEYGEESRSFPIYYAIFFTSRKTADRQCDMTVVSAFCPDNPKVIANSGSMKFNLAVCKILRNQPLKMPK
jgi:hypothetical protein